MIRFGSNIVVAAAALVAASTLGASPALAGSGDDCPPNAEPGKCYEKVLLPGYNAWNGQAYVQVRATTFEWREIPCATGGGYRVSENRVLTSPNLVRAVQSALTVEGYYSGPITGEDNAITERSLQRFQYDRGLQPGWNQSTLRALGVPYPYGAGN